MELATGTPQSTAAMRAGMCETKGWRDRMRPLPNQWAVPRTYCTRPAPFAGIWREIEALLVQAPGLEAVTIFETLRGRPDLVFADGQRRTLQRRIRRWRPLHGPERAIMFPQAHRPGEYAQSDFTSMHGLAITLGREPLKYLWAVLMTKCKKRSMMLSEIERAWSEQLCGTSEAQRFAWPSIQLPGNRIQLFLREATQVAVLG